MVITALALVAVGSAAAVYGAHRTIRQIETGHLDVHPLADYPHKPWHWPHFGRRATQHRASSSRIRVYRPRLRR